MTNPAQRLAPLDVHARVIKLHFRRERAHCRREALRRVERVELVPQLLRLLAPVHIIVAVLHELLCVCLAEADHEGHVVPLLDRRGPVIDHVQREARDLQHVIREACGLLEDDVREAERRRLVLVGRGEDGVELGIGGRGEQLAHVEALLGVGSHISPLKLRA
eukprot:CAMPEP_0180115000 /NCGR_PEP_ID=MMETSP0985-20121206/37623_1 /TAXON_ID=483367 /ORGANISM="non described non described, Strain CCMP 2436" /LENGTH=162 /DNA_ID=CAMNT_0022053623 /DNA_START=180 /DNA_END=669 /DNA_ORIENTATION=+